METSELPRRRRKIHQPLEQVEEISAGYAIRPEAEIRASLKEMSTNLNGQFIDRAVAVRLIQICLLTGMNYLLVGNPGTAKTQLAEAVAQHVVGARYFSPSALGAYTTMSDLVGERDIPALVHEGVSRRTATGRLTAVELAFLDELFKASDQTCNTLLSLFNDRKFEGQKTPLWSVGAATNWPEVNAMKPVVKAFWDRLHLRIVVSSPTSPSDIKKLLKSGLNMSRTEYKASPVSQVTIDELKFCSTQIKDVVIGDTIEDTMISMFNRLSQEKIDISARRLVQLQTILQANAWLDGRNAVSLQDFSMLKHACWTNQADIQKVDAVLDTIDAAFVKELFNSINTVRSMYASNKTWDTSAVHVFIDAAGKVAATVADAITSKSLSKSSERDIRKAVGLLQGEVEEVFAKIK